MKKSKKHIFTPLIPLLLLMTLLLLLSSCYMRIPHSMEVTEVYYNDSTGELEISLDHNLDIGESGFDWAEVCSAENNHITNTYYKYDIIHLQLENTYDTVADAGKKVYFKEKYIKAQNDNGGLINLDNYNNYYIETESKEISF